MKMSRKRILPKVWLSATAICALFLGFAGSTVKASNNETGGYFSLTSVTEYLLGTSVGAYFVGDTISFNPSTYQPGEGAVVVQVTVVRSGNLTGTTVINYTTVNGSGTATGGTACTPSATTNAGNIDYVNQSGTLTFQDGVSQQVINITICQDSVFEGNEAFNINLNTPPNGTTIGVADATITIQDDDTAAAGIFGFSAANPNSQAVSVLETAGPAVLNVTRTGGNAGTVTVNYTVANGTAVGGTSCSVGGAVDFIFPGTVSANGTSSTSTLTFVNGDDLEQITIQICDDGIFENSESFTVTLNNATSASGNPLIAAGANVSTVTINDISDPQNAGVIRFPAATFDANEGVGPNGGANTATNVVQIPVIRTIAAGTPVGAVSVTYTVMNNVAVGGTACTVGVDFIFPGTVNNANNPPTSSTGTLTFPNGSGENFQTQFINITICNNDTGADFNAELTVEPFNITLSNPTGNATIGAGQGTTQVRIIDDAAGTIQFSTTTPVTFTEGNQDPATPTVATLTLTRNLGEGGVVSTQTETVNYTVSGTASFGANGGAAGGTACGTTVLVNNVPTPVDFIFPGAVDNAANPTSSTGSITFGPNITQAVLNISICPDSIFESNTSFGRNEVILVSLSRGSNNSAVVNPTPTTFQNTAPFITTNVPNANEAIIFILDEDTANAGVINVQSTTTSVNESSGVAPGGAAVNGNRVLIAATRSASQESATVVAIINGIGSNGATATGGTSCAAGIDFIFPTGATRINDQQYQITLTFPSGSTTGTFSSGTAVGSGTTTTTAAQSITICNDALFENSETVIVTLSNANSPSSSATLGANLTQTITIIDNDGQPGTVNLVAPTQNVNESGGTGATTSTALIRVSRAGTGNNGAVSVLFTLSNGAPGTSATGGTDCSSASTDFVNPGPQTITIPNGVDFVDVPVTICNNDANDGTASETPTETFNVSITNAQGGAVLGSTQNITVTIQDDAQGTFQVGGATPITVSEGVGTQQITVTRVGQSTNANLAGTATVTFSLSGTAVGATGDCTPGNGVDYIVPAGNNTLTFGVGVTSQTFNITVCDDTLIEGPETIIVTLGQPNNPAQTPPVLIGPNPFTITITDNDGAATFAVTSPQGTAANEGNTGTTPFVFTVTPSAANSQDQTVNFTAVGNGTTMGGAACTTAGVDFINTGGTFVIPANSAAAVTFTVLVCGDAVSEPNETFTVTLTGTTIPANTTATATIVNDDGNQGMIAVGSVTRVNEGDSGQSTQTVTLTLTGNTTAQQSTVQFTFANGTATGGATCAAGIDFINTGNTATFAANATTATITVTVCGDSLKEANETFIVNLSNPTNSSIGTGGGSGTVIIVDNDRAIRADFDRDRRTDFSVFRPSTGQFFILQSINGLFQAESIGAMTGDIAIPGDYDNDSATDLAFYRPSNGTFNIRFSTTNLVTQVQFGLATDIPVPGDYDGNGSTDLAVFRPSNGTFFIANSLVNPNQNFVGIQFGQNGDIPVPADYDGDGRTDAAVFRPSGAIASNANASAFFVRPSSGSATPFGIQFGATGDIPVTGDFDGDGRADFTVFRTTASGLPAGIAGAFFTFQSLTQTTSVLPSFGQAGDIPTVGDYDGDGTDDIAVFRPSGSPAPAPSGAFFFVRRSTDGGLTSRQFGASGDIPLPSRYQATSATP